MSHRLNFTIKFSVLFFIVLLTAFPLDLHAQEEAETGENNFFILGGALSVLFPTGQYKDYTVRSPVGLDISLVFPTRNKDFYAGGSFFYYYHDMETADYLSTGADGWTTRLQEYVYNQHYGLNGIGMYMPDWFTTFQPYMYFNAGMRRVFSRVRIREYIDQSFVNSFTYKGTLMVQMGTGIGFKWRIDNVILDINFNYLETTPGTHLLRKNDWRRVRGDFATDYFDERRVSQQWFGLNIGLNYIIF